MVFYNKKLIIGIKYVQKMMIIDLNNIIICKDISVNKIFVVGNKIRNKEDEEFIINNLEDGEYLGFIYYNQDVINSNRSNLSPYDNSYETKNQVKVIKDKLIGLKTY